MFSLYFLHLKYFRRKGWSHWNRDQKWNGIYIIHCIPKIIYSQPKFLSSQCNNDKDHVDNKTTQSDYKDNNSTEDCTGGRNVMWTFCIFMVNTWTVLNVRIVCHCLVIQVRFVGEYKLTTVFPVKVRYQKNKY